MFGSDHRDTAIVYSYMAYAYRCQNLYSKSFELYIKSYQIFIKTSGETHPDTIMIKERMKEAYLDSELTEPFEEWFERNLTL